jgi:hypothetical protein
MLGCGVLPGSRIEHEETAMAKNQPPGVIPPGSKVVRLELSPEQQGRLRVIAAEAGMSMAAYARLAVERAIEEASKKAPKAKR